ncbi:hypothetical protein D5R95_08195 [Methanosalsum natronophilum]|uniref:Transposase IS701-like DDE domain-containing protein n=1 Tax=Methanosalsum natronophilum TaxID=768733 RepID=A0A3R7XQU6_9EURY|nr:MAG: hypothetical protein D5R95_08195 [Methanosalsum natronophilum]
MHFYTAIDRELTTRITARGWRTTVKKGVQVIDECGNPKAAKHSIGFNRQYCGNMGKVDNCQFGVFMAYTKSERRLLLNYRLYLPAEWITDSARCDAAGILKEHQIFKNKSRACIRNDL